MINSKKTNSKALAASSKNEDGGNRKAPDGMMRCRNCQHSVLLQYGSNPVIAECMKKPQSWSVRFPYEREVADVCRNCKMYSYTDEKKEVKHLEKGAVVMMETMKEAV